jgi:hypothetical protein
MAPPGAHYNQSLKKSQCSGLLAAKSWPFRPYRHGEHIFPLWLTFPAKIASLVLLISL